MSVSKYNQEMVRMVEKRNHQLTILEYRNDIHKHLVQLDLDIEESLPISPRQDQVKILRSSILNSLLDVCFRLSWSSSTFSLAVHLFDTYTSKIDIEVNNCRLIGFCCLWIASKYNENKPKGNILNALIKRSGYEQSAKSTFLKIEFNILTSLNWDLSYPSPEIFLDLFLNTGEPNNLERRLGSMFLCELSLFNLDIVSNYTSSSIAASSIMITKFAMLNLRHKHIRQHRFDELESLMLNQVVKMESSVKLKYLDGNVISYTNNNMVIHNLIYLAQCFVRQKEEEKEQLKKLKDMDLNPNLYYGSNGHLLNTNLVGENGNLGFLPLSPMASPNNLVNNPQLRSSYFNSSCRDHANCPECNSQEQGNGSSNLPIPITSTNDIDHITRHTRSQSLRGVLPTPGTTPTATFNWMTSSLTSTGSSSNSMANSGINSSCSSSHSSVDYTNNNESISETNISQQNSQNLKLMIKTPQIYTPVQLIPSALLYSSSHHNHHHQGHMQMHSHHHHHSLSGLPYSQRYSDFGRGESPEHMVSKRVRQKYQRTLPVLTRSRAKEFVSFGNVNNVSTSTVNSSTNSMLMSNGSTCDTVSQRGESKIASVSLDSRIVDACGDFQNDDDYLSMNLKRRKI